GSGGGGGGAGGRLYDYSVDRLYEESRSGPYCLRYLQTLVENGKSFPSMDDLIRTIEQMHIQTVYMLKTQIKLLKLFLTGPNCKLWYITPSMASLTTA